MVASCFISAACERYSRDKTPGKAPRHRPIAALALSQETRAAPGFVPGPSSMTQKAAVKQPKWPRLAVISVTDEAVAACQKQSSTERRPPRLAGPDKKIGS